MHGIRKILRVCGYSGEDFEIGFGQTLIEFGDLFLAYTSGFINYFV